MEVRKVQARHGTGRDLRYRFDGWQPVIGTIRLPGHISADLHRSGQRHYLTISPHLLSIRMLEKIKACPALFKETSPGCTSSCQSNLA